MSKKSTAEQQPLSSSENSIKQETSSNNLKQLALRGAFWSFLGFGIMTLLRFVNNPLMANLFEENKDAIGIMTVIDAFMVGLILLSDVGIIHSIIRNKHGDEKSFQNTAWTLQVCRGIILFVLSLLLAKPLANFVGVNSPDSIPIIALVLPITALSSLFAGFNATRMAIAQRDLNTRAIVLIELVAFIIGMLVRVIWALVSPTIWALVAGGIAQSAATMVMSWLLPGKFFNSLSWNKSAFDEIWDFGKWIIFSSAMTFAARDGATFLMARRTNFDFMAEFRASFVWSTMIVIAATQMSYKVLYPTFSTLLKDDNENGFQKTLLQSRLATVVVTWIGGMGIIIVAPWLIEFLYPESWWGRMNWIVPIITVGTFFRIISDSYDNAIIAREATFDNAILQGTLFIFIAAAVLIGFELHGSVGMVIGFSIANLLHYPYKVWYLRKHNLWQAKLDCILIIVSALLALIIIQTIN